VQRFQSTVRRSGHASLRRIGSVSCALLVAAGLVSGCASARPGVAAQVGDSRVTLAAVDEATADLCTAFLPQIQEEGKTYPLKVLSVFVAGSLTRQAIARQVSREYDVPLPASYQEAVDAAEAEAEAKPEEVRASFIKLSQARPYAAAIQAEVGRRSLEAEGADASDAEAQAARGAKIFAEWVEDNTVEIDPRYGLAIIDGQVAPADTSVSLAQSPAALAGAAEEMDPAAAALLPASQRCN
jgi:hypothetical protein